VACRRRHGARRFAGRAAHVPPGRSEAVDHVIGPTFEDRRGVAEPPGPRDQGARHPAWSATPHPALDPCNGVGQHCQRPGRARARTPRAPPGDSAAQSGWMLAAWGPFWPCCTS
jgi:hypothetical protein